MGTLEGPPAPASIREDPLRGQDFPSTRRCRAGGEQRAWCSAPGPASRPPCTCCPVMSISKPFPPEGPGEMLNHTFP